jgi:hypothetical protein
VSRLAELNGARSCAIAIAAFVALPAAAYAAAVPAPKSQPSRAMIADFANCLSKRHHREAADYVIRTKIPFESLIRAEKRLSDRACIPTRSSRAEAKALLKLPEELRAALGEALVREEFPTFSISQISAAQPLDYANMVERLWPADACKKCDPDRRKKFEHARATATELTLPLVFGECVVRTDPQNAHRLLSTKANSSEEKAALSSLQIAFQDCVIEGSQISRNRSAVRDLVALNYYRLARAPRVQQTAGAVN